MTEIVERLERQAVNVENDGHVSAARAMREAATALEEARAEIERQNKRLDLLAVGFGVPDGGRYIADWQTRIKKYQDQAAEIEAANYAHARMRDRAHAAESELSTLRARVREVVGGMLAHSCVADAGPDCKDEEDEAVERAARQLMEDLK